MALTIQLTPDQETRLTAFARSQGLDPAELAQKWVTEHLPSLGRKEIPMADRNHFYFTATREEWEAALDALAEMNRNLPVLPDEAFDRENLYEERF